MSTHLRHWTSGLIDAECAQAYGRYERELKRHYTEYFRGHQDVCGDHPLCASSMEAALPAGWSHLAEHIPAGLRHRWCASGKSSQVLALGLLGVAVTRQPDLGWLWRMLGVTAEQGAVECKFERELDQCILNEYPRVTSIDFLVNNSRWVVCTEAKWAEQGLGMCSCARSGGNPEIGACADRVRERSLYWQTAESYFGLNRAQGRHCPLSTAYQAIRNVAAATALASKHQRAAFLLLYDERNPYFGGCGKWLGWPAVLVATLADSEAFIFRTLSWQELVKNLPLDESARVWAREKHRLPVPETSAH